MGIQVTEKVTRSVAELARLELTSEEVTLFTRQLGDILAYVDQVQEVDVSLIEPLTNPLMADNGLETPFREDVAVPSPRDEAGNPKVLKAAPDILDNGYKVPPIL